MIKLFEQIGEAVTIWLSIFYEFVLLTFETIYWIFVGPFKGKKINFKSVFEQMVFMGLQSIIIVFFVIFFTGVVLAMQSAIQLEKMGGTIYVASLVTIWGISKITARRWPSQPTDSDLLRGEG